VFGGSQFLDQGIDQLIEALGHTSSIIDIFHSLFGLQILSGHSNAASYQLKQAQEPWRV
jgi:hypothetical protein